MKRWLAVVLLVLGLGTGTATPATAWAPDPAVDRAAAALAGWDVATARTELADAAESPARDVKLGVVAVYEGDYVEAERLLSEALAAAGLDEDTKEEAKHYLALARGSQKALDGAITVTSPDGRVVAVFADEKDALLAPYLFDAMVQARAALDVELGVSPVDPVRFEFLDDPLKLAMLTPLTTENIRTTGTVGVTKYRRIMMISPRVMVQGYGWIDTAVHEYVHYLVTLRTANQAPVWLQEGLAKMLETRWRRVEPEPLDEAVAFRLHKALVRDELVTLEEMYPSVAMLPSQELAALAYAEVQTMLTLLRERRGGAGISALLDRVAAGDDARDALAAAWGAEFDEFFTEWKKVTKKRTASGEDGPLDQPQFADEEAPRPEVLSDVFSHLGGGRARQHARLGTLLQARGHDRAAAIEYRKARAADPRAKRDAVLARRFGRLLVGLEEYAEAAPILDVAAANAPEDANLAGDQGRARLRTGDTIGATEALGRALRVNPFIPAIHCDLAELAIDETRRAIEQKICPKPR